MAETFYFSHDYNSRADAKIKKLLAKLGYLGYGLFWAIVEDLYNNKNLLQLDYESIAFDLRTTPEMIKTIVHDFDLFSISGSTFNSLSVKKRLDERNEKSLKAKESIQKRWSKYERNTNVLQTNNDSNTIKENKGKESKGKESKGNKSKERTLSPPSLSEFVEYFKANGFSPDLAQRAWSGYEAAGWYDTRGKPVRNWKTKCQNVWFKAENKLPEPGKVVFVA